MGEYEPITYLYFNGLGHGDPLPLRSRLVLRHMQLRGHKRFRTKTDWYSPKSFSEHFDEATDKAEALLTIQRGPLALIGSSAGVSLATNVFGRLGEEHSDLWLFNLPGRTRRGNLGKWDLRTIEWAARKSESFRDSVAYCEDITIPNLIEEDEQRVTTFYNPLDSVVPVAAQTISGVNENIHKVAVPGHGLGILAAGLLLPGAIKQQINAENAEG